MAAPLTPPNTASEMALLADRCVQCGLCLPHCPTYQLDCSEPESPRGRIAYIKSLALDQIAPSEKGDQHLDHCLGCRRCEAACPANVEYGDLLSSAREQQYLRKPPPYQFRLLTGLLARPRLLGIAGVLGRLAGRLPELPKHDSNHPSFKGNTSNKVALFVGCIADKYEAGTRRSLQRILSALDFSVEPIARQTCCGAAAVHMGDTNTSKALAERNRAAFENNITVLTLATGCHEQLAYSLHAQNKVVDALDFIFQHAANLKFKAADKTIALHIPCSQSTVVKSGQAARKLLELIPELNIHHIPDRGCCGAAGLHMLAHTERANRLRAPLIQEILNVDATELLSANIGCRLHIANGLKIPVRHPIDFLAEHLA